MPNVTVELDEAAGVEELLDPLAREKLAPRPLPLDRALLPGVKSLFAEPLELFELRVGPLAVGLRHSG